MGVLHIQNEIHVQFFLLKKGAVKIGTKEQARKNGREQGEWGKLSKGAGSIDPPPQQSLICVLFLTETVYQPSLSVLSNVNI